MAEHKYIKYISDKSIEDLMDSALSGITYWADEAKIFGEAKDQDKDMYLSQALTRGYQIMIHDSEEEKWERLTLKKLLKGLSLTNRFDPEDFDMYDAECVVQLALFGKVIYG